MNFYIDDWHVKPDHNEITKGEETLKLDHKVMLLLQYFAQNSGRDLAKDEIISNVWGEGVFSEEVLTVAVSSLRKALRDDPRSPRYLKTLPRLGYRMLVAPVFSPPSSLPSRAGSRKSLLEFLDERVGLRFLIIAFLVALFLLVLLTKKHLH
ncbi:winged helix-turn-helix domain-containing protein [candidate division KSB1 bacterium]|nr:winged helix-turn-helix domain-containing protein [candidate division KSB1 bacterium]